MRPRYIPEEGPKHKWWFDLSSRFLTPEGVLPKSLFPDSLHPLKPGYVLWKDAVLPYFRKAVGR